MLYHELLEAGPDSRGSLRWWSSHELKKDLATTTQSVLARYLLRGLLPMAVSAPRRLCIGVYRMFPCSLMDCCRLAQAYGSKLNGSKAFTGEWSLEVGDPQFRLAETMGPLDPEVYCFRKRSQGLVLGSAESMLVLSGP